MLCFRMCGKMVISAANWIYLACVPDFRRQGRWPAIATEARTAKGLRNSGAPAPPLNSPPTGRRRKRNSFRGKIGKTQFIEIAHSSAKNGKNCEIRSNLWYSGVIVWKRSGISTFDKKRWAFGPTIFPRAPCIPIYAFTARPSFTDAVLTGRAMYIPW